MEQAARLHPLNPSVRDDLESLTQRFNNATPFRHIVIDDFLEPEFCQSLLDHFPAFDPKRARDENGNIGRKATFNDISTLGAPYRGLDSLIQSSEFLQWLGQLTGSDETLLYDPDYFGGGTHESRHGQDLDVHVDFSKHPGTGDYRRFNLIVYLNHEWQEAWGGCLELHKDPRLEPSQNEIKTIALLFNRCVIFETTFWSWHGFNRLNLPAGDDDERSRKSLALFFYSKQRPEHEQVSPHSTIYVDQPLPAHIQPGLTLSEDDWQSIKILLARRDQHVQRLYGNISELTGRLEYCSRPLWQRVLRRLYRHWHCRTWRRRLSQGR